MGVTTERPAKSGRSNKITGTQWTGIGAITLSALPLGPLPAAGVAIGGVIGCYAHNTMSAPDCDDEADAEAHR